MKPFAFPKISQKWFDNNLFKVLIAYRYRYIGSVNGINDMKSTVIGHTGQQMPGFGGSGLLQATEHMVSLQLSRPPASQVHVVQLFGCQVDPSGCVSFKWSMHETRQRHICEKIVGYSASRSRNNNSVTLTGQPRLLVL